MNTTTGPDPFDQLRAADPAAHIEPDLTALRAAVAKATESAQVTAGPDADTVGLGVTRPGVTGATVTGNILLNDGQVVDELAARRRRTRGWQLAAAVAGVLAIGGGGYGLGALGSSGPATTEADGPGPSNEMAVAPVPGSGMDRTAVGRQGMNDRGAQAAAAGLQVGGESYATTDMVAGFGFGGRTVFSESGLSTSGGTAQMYGYDPAAALNEKSVTALASALGIEGKAKQQDWAWVVGNSNGQEPNLWVSIDGQASFNYANPDNDVWFCSPEPTGEAEDECAERDLGKAVQGQKAIKAATDLFVTMGLDPADFTFTASTKAEMGSDDYSNVTVQPLIDGKEMGNSAWNVNFTGAGVVGVSGTLAPSVDMGEYRVISPAEAVERLGDPRFGVLNSWLEARADSVDLVDSATYDGTGPDTPPATPKAGDPLSWRVDAVTITKAELSMAEQYLSNGAVVATPVYELSDKDGAIWTVLALADEHLDFKG